MIRTFREGMHEQEGLEPLALEAMSPEVAARDPAEKADAGPGKVGELGAVDAG